MESFLRIGQLAERSGVAAAALRYSEARGLVRADRASSGHRRFPRAMLRRVAFIVFARRIGMRLDEIGAELDKLPSDQVPGGKDWAQLSGPWAARIAELQQLRAGLTECIGCGCLSLRSCELINPSDRAARSGAGPRYWWAKAISRRSRPASLDFNLT